MHPRTGLTLLNELARTQSSLDALLARHEEEPRQVWVAADRRRLVGVVSAAFRGRHAHIQSFFVAPGAQQRGIGAELLRRLHHGAREAGCEVFTLQASDDPRALSRYFQLGLAPRAPNVVWSAVAPAFPKLGLDFPFEAIPLSADDLPALNTVADIDKAVRGVKRLGDLQGWLREGAQGALLVDRAKGVPAGYYLVSGGAMGRIGPVAAMDDSRFGEILAAALAAAAELPVPETIWRIATPGENREAIAPLLQAGFRPTFTMTFFASAPIGQFDRYIFHDLDLL